MKISSQEKVIENLDLRVRRMQERRTEDGKSLSNVLGVDGKKVCSIEGELMWATCSKSGAPTRLIKLRIDRGVSFQTARDLLEERKRVLKNHGEPDDGSCFLSRFLGGKQSVGLVLKAKDGVYHTITPNAGWDGACITADDVKMHRAKPGMLLSMPDAEERWRRVYDEYEGYQWAG